MGRYRTSQTAKILGIAPITLKRALLDGRVDEVERDWNDWRVFTDEDIARLRAYFSTRKPVPSLPLFKKGRK